MKRNAPFHAAHSRLAVGIGFAACLLLGLAAPPVARAPRAAPAWTADAPDDPPEAVPAAPDDATCPPRGRCVAPPAGMVSWYTGDYDASDLVGPNDGVLLHGARIAPGFVRHGFWFDGIDDQFDAPSVGMPKGAADRTIEGWVRLDSLPVAPLETCFFGYGGFGYYEGCFSTGTVGAKVFVSQWGQAIFGPPLVKARWCHVAATARSSFVTLYLEGVAVGSRSMLLATLENSRFLMGRIPVVGDMRRLRGMVDDVAVYDRALDAVEIAAIHAAGRAGKCRPARSHRPGIAWATVWQPTTAARLAVSPNPGTRLEVSFVLEGEGPATLSVFDVHGRRVFERAVESYGPGRHSITLGPTTGLPAGVYVLQLVQGERRLVTRAAILR